MIIDERIDVLVELGDALKQTDSLSDQNVFSKAEIENPWFNIKNILTALEAMRVQYLTLTALNKIKQKYSLHDYVGHKKIGLILAGNIPFVGVHDVICCFLCGHISILKYSDKDKILMKWLIDKLIKIDHRCATYFIEVDMLKEYDAAIATGSNASAVHFEYYFRHVPHIIRRNRNSVAVISGQESVARLQLLGEDIFSYFGLGCRNVSMIMIPADYDVRRIIDALAPFGDIIHHHKYKNNYDYNLALMLLNKETFLQSDFFIMKMSDQIISRIASVHYKYYTDTDELTTWLKLQESDIQCVVTDMVLSDIQTVPLGMAQCPAIDDFADGVDTISFLLSI